MEWFKHKSYALDDPKLSKVIDKFGPAGYGVWWIILEKIALEMNYTDRCEISYSVKTWSKFCRISSKKFQIIVKFLQKIELILLDEDADFLTLKCPNLLRYKDEWSKKQQRNVSKTPEQLRSNSGATPAREDKIREDKETHIREVAHSEPTLSPANADDVFLIFEYWKKVHNHPKAKLDEQRKRKIKLSLKNYSVDQLKKAIDGCKRSKHHMGENKDGVVYDDISLILRDSAHIEKFIRLTENLSSENNLRGVL